MQPLKSKPAIPLLDFFCLHKLLLQMYLPLLICVRKNCAIKWLNTMIGRSARASDVQGVKSLLRVISN